MCKELTIPTQTNRPVTKQEYEQYHLNRIKSIEEYCIKDLIERKKKYLVKFERELDQYNKRITDHKNLINRLTIHK